MLSKKNQKGASIFIIVLALAIVAFVIYFAVIANNNSKKSDKMMKDDVVMEDDTMMEDVSDGDMKADDMMEVNDKMMDDGEIDDEAMMKDDKMTDDKPQTGVYDHYSPEAYAAAASSKRVLFFHAKWCPTCKVADASITSGLSKIPAGVVIFKTDYDTEIALKEKYKVTYQHTFVQVDENGNEVAKWNGGDIEEIIDNVI